MFHQKKWLGIKNPCKYLACRDFLWRVPGRTRTVDIQNHKQSIRFFGFPCVSRGLPLSQKSYLRRFCVDFGTQLIISMNSRISS